jgi:RloB-like protein
MRDNQPKHRQAKRHQRKLERRRASRQGMNAILIVCEGAETEPNYIRGLCESNRVNMAAVDLRRGDKATDPVSLVRKARQIFERDPTFDRVFVVCDGDGNVDEARALAEQRLRSKGRSPLEVELIISRPSIEFWLLLHFEYSSRPYRSAAEAIDALLGHLPRYDKVDRRIFEAVAPGLQQAIVNTGRLKREIRAAGSASPDTDFAVLAEVLLAMRS